MSTRFEDVDRAWDGRSTLQAAGAGVRTALGGLSEASLVSLRGVAAEPNDIAPALMVWIEHAAAWELDRRAGRPYALHDPLEAINAAELSSSVLALAALSSRFADAYPAVARFFGAIVAALNVNHVMH